MRNAAAILALLALEISVAGSARAQREHPITEVIRAPAGGIVAHPGATFTVTLAVDIPHTDKVWHLYSITQAPGGPIRTRIGVEPSATFRVAGEIKASDPVIADDPNFGIPTETYADSAIFRIPVVGAPTASGTQRLTLSMYYQTCNDRYCLPPTEDKASVDVKLTGAAVGNSAWPKSKSGPNG